MALGIQDHGFDPQVIYAFTSDFIHNSRDFNRKINKIVRQLTLLGKIFGMKELSRAPSKFQSTEVARHGDLRALDFRGCAAKFLLSEYFPEPT